MVITSTHGDIVKLKSAYTRLVEFFNEIKAIALQLTSAECWCRILAKAMEKFKVNIGMSRQRGLPSPT